jgi:uncharacterized membrane protein (DUF373 family)
VEKAKKVIKEKAVQWSEAFSDLMNIVLLISLAVISLVAVWLLVLDTYSYFKGHETTNVGHVLGSLLILWVLMELLHTQIEYLKGGKFDISVFILVAMVAFVRKLLVASIKATEIKAAYYPLAVIFVLGLVYLMVKLVDNRKRE